MIKEESKQAVQTPLMKQYYAIKAKYPDALLLFRVGDFYEMFGEDAVRASAVLGIVLTRRANGSAAYIELAGFPHHSLDTYLPKLVRAGHRVAICDQLEDPKLTKKIVKRGVTELVSPGVAYSDKILDHKKNNFLAAIHFEGSQTGLAFIDISTGEFFVAQGTPAFTEKLLQNFNPGEILYSRNHKKEMAARPAVFPLDEWVFQPDYARETLQKHFGTVNLKGFGIEEMSLAIIAAGAALHYVSDTRQDRLRHITGIARIEEDDNVWLDKFTVRNLEIVAPSSENGVSLLDVIDQTITPMGGRMLRRWLLFPLREVKRIEKRQEIVHHLLHHQEYTQKITASLREIGDLERLTARASLGKIAPREIQQLGRSLAAVQRIKEAGQSSGHAGLEELSGKLHACDALKERIHKELHPDPPAVAAKGGLIRDGFHAGLDELRGIAYHGKDYLLRLQQREATRTGISSLKVGFNNVFGYYMEVTHTHKDKVPPEWSRKQTLTNAERYITEELKQYEEKILGAEQKIQELEMTLYNELVAGITTEVEALRQNARLIATLDCLLSFSITAQKNDYVRPQVNESLVVDIKNGRHPVIERQLPQGEQFVANDIYLDPESQQILMITGPNMSGKSALLRQAALITLLAQVGSYVPASSAQIGIVDKIFTRVGASDNISSGESTFMVEMNETASILHNISPRSLILLDEIGRGTATYDGISIAWAIAEYLHEHDARPKTLFATHYHELNDMADRMQRIRNFHVSVKELTNNVIFLRKLVPGGSEHSFGIHVARMAGVPSRVVHRAKEMLHRLESTRQQGGKPSLKEEMQLSFFQLDDPVLEQIKEEIVNTDIDNLTPVQALNKLNEIKKILGGK